MDLTVVVQLIFTSYRRNDFLNRLLKHSKMSWKIFLLSEQKSLEGKLLAQKAQCQNLQQTLAWRLSHKNIRYKSLHRREVSCTPLQRKTEIFA